MDSFGKGEIVINTLPAALTIGEIARRIGEPIHRVDYVIKSRNIQPVQRAGHCRVFSEANIDFIAAELRRIDAEKGVL